MTATPPIDDLFGAPPALSDTAAAEPLSKPKRSPGHQGVQPAAVPPEVAELALRLPSDLRIGTSSWSYPGWDGLVYAGEYSESMLARKGLAAYARHPLLRTVSIDRGFYAPIPLADYVAYAALSLIHI